MPQFGTKVGATAWATSSCALGEALYQISEAPASHHPLEFWSGSGDVRRCLLRRFPYMVVFQSRPDEQLVVAIAHVRRQPLYWLERLG
jgi:hypothetical protein